MRSPACIYGGAGVELSQVCTGHPRATSRPSCTAFRSASRRPTSPSRTIRCWSERREDFVLPVRELRAYTGAGWLVAVCGDTQTMPGLPAHSAAERMDLDAEGGIVGLA